MKVETETYPDIAGHAGDVDVVGNVVAGVEVVGDGDVDDAGNEDDDDDGKTQDPVPVENLFV